MIEDEFEWPEDEIEEGSQLSITEEAKIKVLETIKEYADKTIESIRIGMKSEEEVNFTILSRYVTNMVEIENLEKDDSVTVDEVFFKIQEIEKSVTKVDLKTLKEERRQYEEERPQPANKQILETMKKNSEDDSMDDSALDF